MIGPENRKQVKLIKAARDGRYGHRDGVPISPFIQTWAIVSPG